MFIRTVHHDFAARIAYFITLPTSANISSDSTVTAEKLWYKDMPTGKRRKIIPDKLRRVFAGKQIVCVEYQDITENDEREIFQRVQLGMALTPAEKLQVINTPRVAFVRSLQNLHIKDGGLSSANLEWDSSRGGDFRCLAQALWLIDKYSPSIKNAGSISQLEKWLSITSPLSASFTDKALDTYRIFSELVQHPTWGKPLKDKTKSSGKVSPIEFICVSLLISVYRTKMSMAQLSAAIAGLRDDVRSTHVDIRMNNRVAKTMLDYVRGIKPGAPDGPVAAEYTASLESGANGKGKGKAKRKRGKAGDDDDDDGDESEYEEPLKIRLKMGKAPATTAALPAPPPTLPPKPQAPPTTVVKSEPSLPSLPSRPSASAASTSSRLAALRSIPRIPRYEAPTQPASMSSTAPSTYSMHSSVIPHAQQLPTPSPGQTYTYPSALSAVVGGHQPGYGSSSGYGGSGYDSRSSSAYASRDVQGTQYRAEPRDLGPVHPSRQGNIVAGGAGGGSSDRRNSSGSGYYRESDAGWRR
ncbi:hypothetical protein FA15DRAFT_697665 [Coprinopsis marcescibilis]|uniref:Uncharacterized protein n=1 Tax=Coprinopsis marcescibilis TaxID=230819 RepID=A0A5C3KGY9_COPMA|nr:hypothetical protein FA15DRAFT_697665 [Coprinopsis marcescibilis]